MNSMKGIRPLSSSKLDLLTSCIQGCVLYHPIALLNEGYRPYLKAAAQANKDFVCAVTNIPRDLSNPKLREKGVLERP